MTRALAIFQRPKSGVNPPKAATIRHSTFQIRHFPSALSPHTPSLPGPEPANDATRKKQIPFRKKQIPFRQAAICSMLTLSTPGAPLFRRTVAHAASNVSVRQTWS